jgi:unsaturated rhamnogalacturonyl hydrolase
LDAVISYRDKNTGLWYQIIDKGEREDNWIEFSASCLFLYSICKSVRLGLVPEKYLSETDKTYHSLFHFVEIDENGELAVEGTCMGTNVGDYKHYINRKRVTNDFHGVGALVMTLVEFDKRKINLNREE